MRIFITAIYFLFVGSALSGQSIYEADDRKMTFSVQRTEWIEDNVDKLDVFFYHSGHRQAAVASRVSSGIHLFLLTSEIIKMRDIYDKSKIRDKSRLVGSSENRFKIEMSGGDVIIRIETTSPYEYSIGMNRCDFDNLNKALNKHFGQIDKKVPEKIMLEARKSISVKSEIKETPDK